MKDERLRGISCFSGIGGLDLALQEDVRTVCYIEWDGYCQEVLKKRAEEGWLDVAPIWDNITTFDGKPWRGKCDILFGGFPCQDISNAGKGAGIKEGTRSGLFFQLMRIVGEVRPKIIFLENVSAINRRGIDIVLGSISEAGYDAEWMHLRASEVGAHHRRERWFCLATLSDSSSLRFSTWGCVERGGNLLPKVRQASEGEQTGSGWRRGFGKVCEDTDVADSELFGCVHGQPQEQPAEGGEYAFCQFKPESNVAYCECEGLQRGDSVYGWEMPFGLGGGVWKRDPANECPTSESFVGRVAYGVSKRVDRLKCLGNAVVPLQGRTAWKMLTNQIVKGTDV